MSDDKKGFFKLRKVTQFKELSVDMEIPESDLCFQNDDVIAQFEYIKPEEEEKFEIEPGTYTLVNSNAGVRPAKTELRSYNLLTSIDNTSKIIKEAEIFFNKLDVYRELEQPMKRAVLMASKPGMGKTASISQICNTFVKTDPGTVVFNWPSSDVDADDVSKFLSVASEYTKECTRLLLIIEDIGDSSSDEYRGRNSSAGLLNLLDGVGVAFKLPTFILATTNHPEQMVEALADRPGRFDLKIDLSPPNYIERVALAEFIAKRPLSEEEKQAFGTKGAENFSIAHIKEVIIRSRLHDKSYQDVINELVAHSKRFKEGFEDPKTVSLGIR